MHATYLNTWLETCIAHISLHRNAAKKRIDPLHNNNIQQIAYIWNEFSPSDHENK